MRKNSYSGPPIVLDNEIGKQKQSQTKEESLGGRGWHRVSSERSEEGPKANEVRED